MQHPTDDNIVPILLSFPPPLSHLSAIKFVSKTHSQTTATRQDISTIYDVLNISFVPPLRSLLAKLETRWPVRVREAILTAPYDGCVGLEITEAVSAVPMR